MTTQVRWFGREPALVIQTLAAVASVLLAFGLPGLSDGLIASMTAFLTAVAAAWTALTVRPIGPAVFTGVITTGATLGAAFGLDLSQQQVGVVAAAAIAVMTMWTRAQVTPEHDPVPV
jgi:repressor of nif and glnA expression